MTNQRKILRILIITVVTIGLSMGIRELFYFQSIHRSSLMVKMELPELIESSAVIVRGTVTDTIGTSRYYDDAGELVVGTRWKLVETESLKGDAPESLIVRTLGGRSGLTEMLVEDEVEFTPGETALVFLEIDPDSEDYRVVGNFQGHFTIQGDLAVQQETGEQKPLSEFISLIQQ
ncbi:MAG: hypothetical protein ABII24_02545 [bacterium]